MPYMICLMCFEPCPHHHTIYGERMQHGNSVNGICGIRRIRAKCRIPTVFGSISQGMAQGMGGMRLPGFGDR